MVQPLVDETGEQLVTSSWSCPDCSGQLVTSQGHIVCTECGLVVSREYVHPTYQMGEEQHGETPDAAMYVSLGNRMHIVDGLGSYMGFHKDTYFRDAHGQALSGLAQKRFKRLKTVYSARIRIGRSEAKYRALRTLNHVSKSLMLSDQVRDRTAYLYKKVISDAKDRVTNNILLMAVCLLMAVREFKDEAPITLEEIADVFEKCGHRVNVRAMVREAMRLKSVTGHAPDLRQPEDYIPRVLSMLMNSPEVVGKAKLREWDSKEYENAMRNKMFVVLDLIPASRRGGRNPFIFVVSVAYASDRIVAIEHGRHSVLTQKLVSNATEVAEYSIRDHYGMIKKILDEGTTKAPELSV